MSNPQDAHPPPEDVTVERYHELTVATQNPVYVWLAINHILQGPDRLRGDWPLDQDLRLPGWIAAYLQQAGDLICTLAVGLDPRVETAPLDLSKYSSWEEAMNSDERREIVEASKIEPTDAMKVVPAALGLTREGQWNAFASFEATTNKMQEFQAYEAMKAQGILGKVAADAIGKGIGVNDLSRVYERIREGRKLAAGDGVGNLPPVDCP